jgi:hypothetical protein
VHEESKAALIVLRLRKPAPRRRDDRRSGHSWFVDLRQRITGYLSRQCNEVPLHYPLENPLKRLQEPLAFLPGGGERWFDADDTSLIESTANPHGFDV